MNLEKVNKEIAKELYEMELHEEIEVTELCYVVRVIGGWIYKFYKFEDSVNGLVLILVSTSFVPYDNQMQ